jgi:hypothetical protein
MRCKKEVNQQKKGKEIEIKNEKNHKNKERGEGEKKLKSERKER